VLQKSFYSFFVVVYFLPYCIPLPIPSEFIIVIINKMCKEISLLYDKYINFVESINFQRTKFVESVDDVSC